MTENKRIPMINEDFIAFTGDTGDFELLHKDYELAELAQLFPNVNSILIPRKAEYNLKKYVSKSLLREIDPNIDIAVEKCLLVLSNLSSTIYVENNEDEENRWKHLSSEILHQQTKNNSNTYVYPRIIEALVAGTKTGAMIEVDKDYIPSEYSRRYRIPNSYFKAGLTEYFIKDIGIIQNRNRMYYEQLNKAFDNPICANLLKIYPMIKLPSSEELLVIGKQLVKDGYTTKKGKRLTMRNKHKNDYWADSENRSFVENNIELFEFLINRGFMVPSVGDERSGGRVVDSFTLMPAWIRNEIIINGKKLSECDYVALHPNIAIHLYNGKIAYLTHDKVAELSGIGSKDVKIEHLSFFNKKWYGMTESPLFDYYSKNETTMLENIYKDKKANGYKITSKKMFAVEVEIMTDVIKYLNSVGVYVLYVYDALLCEEKDQAMVMETMNRIILEHGVKTTIKDTSAKIDVECAIVENEIQEQEIGVVEAEKQIKYDLDEIVNLYEVLPKLSFTADDTIDIISGINRSKIEMNVLVKYIGKLNKEQRYNDYNGVPITADTISKLKDMIVR
ncbi:hypothetical protein [Flavobacterium sp.]|uniref:hypothetical protein n=1 Tax=Flavobacterium sp. TaxID=239 RepID=UPI003D6B38E0